jgi:hypothetical protein
MRHETYRGWEEADAASTMASGFVYGARVNHELRTRLWEQAYITMWRTIEGYLNRKELVSQEMEDILSTHIVALIKYDLREKSQRGKSSAVMDQ